MTNYCVIEALRCTRRRMIGWRQTAVATYGRINCAHNNAGIEGVWATTANYPEDDWERVMVVNLKGAWLCVKYELP